MPGEQETCEICERVQLSRQGRNPYFIAEFKHSIFVLGDHQFHRGYTLVLFKGHVRELHELETEVQSELFQEVMTATRAIVKTFQPWKMNHACYGNAVPHIHWHLFPRYETDPNRTGNPWKAASEFDKHRTELDEARKLIEIIRRNL